MPTRTILLADPDPLQQQLVDMLLAADDLHIVTAGNGRDTLEFLREHTPNLAILALELPDIGGDAICRKLKAVTRLSRVPVILTVKPPGEGGISHDVRQLARSAEADLLLQKPLGDKGLREKVNHLLRRWQEKQPVRPSSKDGENNTVIIEQALRELGQNEDGTATLDAVTEALYRENEDLRSEVASLKRRLARLESNLMARREGVDPPAGFLAGDDPAGPANGADREDGLPESASRDADAPAAAHGAAGGDDPEPEGSWGAAVGAPADGEGAEAGEEQVAAGAAGGSEPDEHDAEPVAGGPGAGERTEEESGAAEGAGSGTAPPAGLLPDSLPEGASREELQHRIVELERRNRALIAALEKAESSEEAPKGLFGRRKR